MPVRLLVGQVGSGKTGRALEIFKRFTPSEHREMVRFVVPTVSHILQVRRFLLSDPDFTGLLGDPVCTFHELARDILGQSISAISESAKLLLLREAVPPGSFDAVRDTPGFAKALGSTLDQLRLGCIFPEDLRRVVSASGRRLHEISKRKILDLADLYQGFEDVLADHGVMDREAVLLHALDALRADPDILRRFKCVIFDGFTKFNTVQRELVNLFTEHAEQVIITSEDALDIPGASVEHLTRTVSPEADLLIGATPTAEIELIAGEIKKLVREGRRFDEIAVVSRPMDSYRRKMEAVFREYGLTLAMQFRPLSDSALAHAVLTDSQKRTPDEVIADFPWPEDESRLQEEYAALRSLRRILAEIEPLLGSKQFLEMLEDRISTSFYRVPGEADGVSLISANSLNGRKFPIVFAVGLVEGSLPREDPFLLDSERKILNRHLPHPLELSSAYRERERYLFDAMTGSAQERLFLSYPEIDDFGQANMPSRFIDQFTFRTIRSNRDAVPTIENAQTARSLTARAVLDCCTAEDAQDQEIAAEVCDLLLQAGRLHPDVFEYAGADYPQETDELDEESE